MYDSGTRAGRYAKERLRFRILEHVYLNAGEDCERPVSLDELEGQLDVPRLKMAEAVRYLTDQAGYLEPVVGDLGRFCITPEGLRYIKSGAGMRRSVRG